jgi:7-carboxy-7-deazaguanine synthase (Cx14CxxC type)
MRRRNPCSLRALRRPPHLRKRPLRSFRVPWCFNNDRRRSRIESVGRLRVGYAVKECFVTLQGEGHHTGRRAVFVRFAGCNLWSGREADRHKGAGGCARWCDTDFVGTDGPGGGHFADANALADKVRTQWGDASAGFVVCTGGEPLLQLDRALVDALHVRGLTVAIETNGTLAVPDGIDWVCVSPKQGGRVVLTRCDELKVVIPQRGLDPREFDNIVATHRYVQPLDGPERVVNTALAVRWCLEHPAWRLSLQTHKLLGIP